MTPSDIPQPPSALFPQWDEATLREKLFDLFAFSRDVLGYKDLSDFHLAWYDQFLRNRFLLLLSPRGHLKTSAITTGYALWRLTQNRNLRILILNEVLSNAKDILGAIKTHITSERFRELHGNWDTLGEMWTAEKIQVPRDKVLKEPSISVAGILGTILSAHADLILLDDPQGDRNSGSPMQRKKVLSWFQKVVLPILEPGGQIGICRFTALEAGISPLDFLGVEVRDFQNQDVHAGHSFGDRIVIDQAIPVEPGSFGRVKALFRCPGLSG